jgi:polyhydroxyalkanoate synthesis regulator phasin
MNGEQVPKQIMGMWKTSWETYLKTLKATEEQGDRMLDLMLQQSDNLQEEGKKLVRQLIDNSKKVSKSYLDAVEQNIKKMEDILEPKEKKE